MASSSHVQHVALSNSDEFTTIAVEHNGDGRVEIFACGMNPDVFTTLALTETERRALIDALLAANERVIRAW